MKNVHATLYAAMYRLTVNGYYPFFGNSLPGKMNPFKFLGLLKIRIFILKYVSSKI